MAHLRYKVWAATAEKEGYPNVARLFRAISYAEEVHGGNHFRELAGESGDFLVAAGGGFGLGSSSANLQGAIDGENFEVDEMYPAYKETAASQGEKSAMVSFHYALEAEKIHAVMYRTAKDAVDSGADVELGPVQICSVCGHTVEGDIPGKCPVCAAGPEQFRTFDK
jgi:rubrerythrin